MSKLKNVIRRILKKIIRWLDCSKESYAYKAIDEKLNLIAKNQQNQQKQINDILAKLDEIQNTGLGIEKISKQNKSEIEAARKAADEGVWASVFHDSISECEWIENRTFFPGRWAAGYQLLYVLYRVLDEIKPTCILEMGLGQTTRLISQYADGNKNVNHYVTEHDDAWIEFFNKSYSLPDNTEILKQNLSYTSYKEDDSVLVYENFEESVKGKKFDLISIDAPFGGHAKVYSRIDVLRLLPNCLADSFVIIMDDCNRKGEKNTFSEMEKVLSENNIKYSKGIYRGNKETYVLVSEDLSFVCSL